MPSVILTKRSVESIKPADRDILVWDAKLPGFGCKVTPAGRRVYFVYYRTRTHQQRRPTIGQHGTLTVEQARKIAWRWLAAVKDGKDPSGERIAARKSETVAELAERYLDEYAAHEKKASSAATDRSNIENHIIPLLGRLKVRDVTRADIERAKHAIRTGKTPRNPNRAKPKPRGRRVVTGGAGIANRCVALLSKMFERAEAWGLRENNPVRRIQKYKEAPRRRFLSTDELKRLHAALGTAEQDRSENQSAISAIRLLLYTGARLGEIVGLRWREVDLNAACLRLEDSKTGSDVIALGSPALAVLNAITKRGPDDLVIEGDKASARLAVTRPWYRIRETAGLGKDVTLHSLRHTFASWSVMGGFSLAQTGAVLRHKSAQTTMGYAHHSLESRLQTAEAVASAIAATATAPEPAVKGAGLRRHHT